MTLDAPSRWSPQTGTRVAAAVVLVAVAVGSGVTGALVSGAGRTRTIVRVAAPVSSGGVTTGSFAQVATAVQPSVVSITMKTPGGSVTGSGLILRSDGTIVTDNHVVAGSGAITVQFFDGTTAAAQLVGRDAGSDLAVIRAKAVSGRTAATLATTATVHVGDSVLSVGSLLSANGSVSAGIVSGERRTSVGDALETDAAINAADSGGPLVDGQGQVIGLDCATASGTVGFAVPAGEVESVTKDLLAGKSP